MGFNTIPDTIPYLHFSPQLRQFESIHTKNDQVMINFPSVQGSSSLYL